MGNRKSDVVAESSMRAPDDLVELITTVASWDDLVLPPTEMGHLMAIAQHVRNRPEDPRLRAGLPWRPEACEFFECNCRVQKEFAFELVFKSVGEASAILSFLKKEHNALHFH